MLKSKKILNGILLFLLLKGGWAISQENNQDKQMPPPPLSLKMGKHGNASVAYHQRKLFDIGGVTIIDVETGKKYLPSVSVIPKIKRTKDETQYCWGDEFNDIKVKYEWQAKIYQDKIKIDFKCHFGIEMTADVRIWSPKLNMEIFKNAVFKTIDNNKIISGKIIEPVNSTKNFTTKIDKAIFFDTVNGTTFNIALATNNLRRKAPFRLMLKPPPKLFIEISGKKQKFKKGEELRFSLELQLDEFSLKKTQNSPIQEQTTVEPSVSLEHKADKKADNNGTWTYIADDKIGDFRVYVDENRFLRVIWKGKNILLAGGEMYAPAKQYFPKGTLPVYLFPNDILVKRVRGEENEVIYRWGYRDISMKFRQLNEVKVTKDRVLLSSLLEFQKGNKKDIIFHPFLFPGTLPRKQSRGVAEQSILGELCKITKKNGKRYEKKYPDVIATSKRRFSDEELELDPMLSSYLQDAKSSAFPWLASDTESIIFPLQKNPSEDTKNKIRFTFLSSDPNVSTGVLANAKSVLGGGTKVYPPATAVVWKISPHKRYYKCQLQMEIAIGEAANQKSLKLKPIQFEEQVDLSIHSNALYHTFNEGGTINFTVNIDNSWNPDNKQLDLLIEVTNYRNQLVASKKLSAEVKGKSKIKTKFSLPDSGKGIFSIVIKAEENGVIVGQRQIRYAVVPKPALIDASDSMFGVMCRLDIWRGKDKLKKYDDLVKFLKKLGIRSVRTMASSLRWYNLEKEKGQFNFDTGVDEIIDIFERNGMDMWFSGYDFQFSHTGTVSSIPKWARGKETFHWRRPILLPKEMSLYTNYMAAIAQHYKGKIRSFECFNEPHRISPKDYVKILKAFHEGVKRGNPDAVVLGAAPCSIKGGGLNWVISVLEDEEGAKYVESIPYHHYVNGTLNIWSDPEFKAPEDNEWVPPLRKISKLAKKHNLKHFCGEVGWTVNYEDMFPEKHFKGYEKQVASGVIRAYLLAKANNAGVITQCFSLTPLRLPEHAKGTYLTMVCRASSMFDNAYCLQPREAALANLAALIDDAEFIEKIKLPVKRLYALVFEKDGYPIIALWSLAGKTNFTVNNDGSIEKILDIMGNETIPENKKISIQLTREPVYLKGEKGGARQLISLIKTAQIELDEPLAIVGIEWETSQATSIYFMNRGVKPLVLNSVELDIENHKVLRKNIILPPIGVKRINLKIPFDLKHKRYEAELRATYNNSEKTLKTVLVHPRWFFEEGTNELKDILVCGHTVKKPEIDGNITDWPRKYPMKVDYDKGIFLRTSKSKWRGKEDLAARGYAMWDKDNLYLAFEVEDDKHVQNAPGYDGLWDGDSIEIVLETGGKINTLDKGDFHLCIGLTKKGPYIVRSKYGTNPFVGVNGPIPNVLLAIIRKKNKTIYEMAIPLTELSPFSPEPNRMIKFNYAVNDNDGNGREKWAGITLGIGEGKKPQLYKKLIFKKNEKTK